MKSLIIYLLLSSLTILLFAQTSEFKKINDQRNSITAESYYDLLRNFQKEYNQFPAVYYQLGEIELNLFSSLDPLVDRLRSEHYIRNAKTNYSLCINFMDTKEAAKNPEWYNLTRIKNKDSLAIILEKEPKEKYQDILKYTENYQLLVKKYDKAVSNYLFAREEFISINNSADNLRELFLNTNDSLKMRVSRIGQSFDSCIFYLEQYEALNQTLPHANRRNVQIYLDDIHHFRMNGITPTNFLSNEIRLWNYKKWSDNFSALLITEVDGLRNEIEQAYTYFLSTNEKMFYGDQCLQANLDDLRLQRIINLITKYDNNSILIDIFTYLGNKLHYGNQLVYERNCNIIDGLPTDKLLSRKARTFQGLNKSLKESDSVANVILISKKDQENFGWFYQKYMPETNGSRLFAENQIKENDMSFAAQIKALVSLWKIQRMRDDVEKICYQRNETNLMVSDDSTEVFCLIKKMIVSPDMEIAIFQKESKTFICGLQPFDGGYEIVWEQAAKSSIDFFKVLSDSSFIYGGTGNEIWMDHMYASGKKLTTFALKEKANILEVLYDDLSGEYTVITGVDDKASKMYQTTNLGKLKKTVTLSQLGTFSGLLVNDQRYWVFTGLEGVLSVQIFDANLVATETKNYHFQNTLSTPMVIKNDNTSLTVIAVSDAESQIYSLIDYEGNVKYESLF